MSYGAIAIVDQSQGDSGWSATDGATVVDALTRQLRYHVQPEYRYVTAPVVWCGSDPGKIPHGAWPIYLLKNPDVAGALGYHDVDPNGNPYGRVFTSVSKQAKVSLSSVLSHEVVEAFVDPYANDWSDQGTRCIAHEACDPVQNSSYQINGVEVSNFVTRAWFDSTSKGGRYDWLNHLTTPFQLERGGYLIVMADGKVSQQMGESSEGEGSAAYRAAIAHAEQPSRSTWREVHTMREPDAI
jgi:hypothetical protein